MERDYDPNDFYSMVKAVELHWPKNDPKADYARWRSEGCIGCTWHFSGYGISTAIYWRAMPEGFNYWRDLSNALDNYHAAHARG